MTRYVSLSQVYCTNRSCDKAIAEIKASNFEGISFSQDGKITKPASATHLHQELHPGEAVI